MRLVLMTAALAISAGVAAGQDETCISNWETATEAGIIYGVGVLDGVPTVEVDEAVWKSVPFDTKVGMVETLTCAALPAGQEFRIIVFVSHLSHKQLGRWENRRLTVN